MVASFTQPLLKPRSCKRGPEGRRPILRLPRVPGARSVLVLKLESGIECVVHLAPRYTAVLLFAADAWQADEGEIETERGFRTAEEIGERLGEFSHTGDSVTKETVKAYVHEIKSEVEKQVSRAMSSRFPRIRWDVRPPLLIEPRRKLGYRLHECGLEIVQPRMGQASGH